MDVYIYDVDYRENGSPNFLAMRVSSYHKQLGDTVTLLRPQDKMPKFPKCVYVFRQDPNLPKPPISMLMNNAVHVHGIQYFDNWTPSDAQLACRPDYLLYPKGRDRFERADVVQLSNERGELLKARQNFHNTETNKATMITDEHLWSVPTSELVKAFDSLRGLKNIYFLKPITLSRLLDDKELREAFMKLRFANGKTLQWANSIPFTRQHMAKVFNFFDEFKARHIRVNVGDVEFYPQTISRSDIEDLKLCIEAVLGMKERCWKFTIGKLKSRLDSVYVHYYEILHNWSIQPHLSFFELIAQTPATRLRMSVEEYYCHPELWTDEMFRAGIELYHHFEEWGFTNARQLACWQYKDKYWSAPNMNWSALLTKELWY